MTIATVHMCFTVDGHRYTKLRKNQSPLQDFLENIYNAAGKRTKRGVARLLMKNLGWSDMETASLIAWKHALEHQVTVVHPDPMQSP